MLQHCVTENSLIQVDIFNFMKIMDILHKYHAKHKNNFDFIRPNGEHKDSPQLPSDPRNFRKFPQKFPPGRNTILPPKPEELEEIK